MKRLFISFLLIITLVCNFPCSVYASGNLSGWDNWTISEKASYLFSHAVSVFSGALGFVVSQGSNTQDVLLGFLQACYDDLQVEDCTYEEWLASRLDVEQNESTGEYELVIDDELLDLMYSASVKYINNSQNWINFETVKPSQVDTSYFGTQTAYNTFSNYVNGSESINKIFIVKGIQTFTAEMAESYGLPNDGTNYVNGTAVYVIDLATDCITYEQVSSRQRFYFYRDWLSFKPPILYFHNDGGVYTLENTTYNETSLNTYENYGVPQEEWRTRFVNQIPKVYRLYRSIDDFKEYSVGHRPYYVTEKFTNYDSTVDNSTTITQTEIDNSITYGDVYNYIINNYDNPDGLTEEELRAILEEYLSQIGGGSGSGSGGGSGGSDDGGSSGGGLGSFLEGLGSIGDAILSILGKLLEYIGKALELLTGTVTKVLDLIPSNITNLLLGLFPFIPQEWVTAIELSLVLGVVLAVVGAFKK